MRLSLLLIVLQPACAATLPNRASSKHCNSLASSVAHLGLKVTLVNSTFIPKHGLNITSSSTLNAIPFCRVYGTVAYGSNETIHMETWLPDADEYNGKFLAIGNAAS